MRFQASRLADVVPAASVMVSQQARELRAAGRDIIDLGLGEPDFDTPAHIIEAAFAAARAGCDTLYAHEWHCAAEKCSGSQVAA